MTEELIRVPTLDGQNSCWADVKQTGRLACAKMNVCDGNPSQCTSGLDLTGAVDAARKQGANLDHT